MGACCVEEWHPFRGAPDHSGSAISLEPKKDKRKKKNEKRKTRNVQDLDISLCSIELRGKSSLCLLWAQRALFHDVLPYIGTYGEEALPRSNTVITSTTNHPNPPVPIWRQSRNTSECTTLHHLPKLSCYLHQSHATRTTTDRKHDWTWVKQPTYMYRQVHGPRREARTVRCRSRTCSFMRKRGNFNVNT